MPLAQLGRYEIVGELGRGAMGVVYKARDPLLDRTVALKTVGLELSREEADAFEQRFYREAKSAGRLAHPNIVTVHDVGKSDSVAYIAMEFLQGRSLREILDSGVVLPVERIVEIAAQVADGLAFAHESGIVHRDVKPPNIMVLDSGLVKITDFGIALLPTGSRTVAGTVFGSPKYMSPEQVAGRPVDGRADIFSLGAVLYEMLTGFAPFFGGDLEAVLYQVINETPAPPSARNKALPPAFDYIVAKALSKRPDDRYADARAFAADLRGFRELRPAAALPRTLDALERRAVRRRKGEGVSAAAAAASALEEAAAVPGAEHAAAGAEGSSAARSPPARSPRLRAVLMIGLPAALLVVGGAASLVKLGAYRAPAVEPRATPTVMQTSAESANSAPGIAASGHDDATPLPTAPSASSTVAEPASERTSESAEQRAASPRPASQPSTPKRARAAGARASTAHATTASSATAHATKPVGRLDLAVSPWGEIYVDGRKRGLSPPLSAIKLPPGRHTIEIRNAAFAPYTETVNLEANASVKLRHKFR